MCAYVCMCICVYVHMCVCAYVCMCMLLCMYAFIDVYVYVSMFEGQGKHACMYISAASQTRHKEMGGCGHPESLQKSETQAQVSKVEEG